MIHDDYEKEPVPGLPAHLPEGEHIVWQGSPNQASFLRNVLHGRIIALYFGALIAWRFGVGFYDGNGLANTSVSVLWACALGAAVLGLAWLFARAVKRTTIYTITNKRVVMRFGVALPITFNYPFSKIIAADVRRLENGRGTITLSLKEHTKVAWAVLWPHARPWKLSRPQPAMLTVDDVEDVALLLADVLKAAHGQMPVRPDVATAAPVAPERAQRQNEITGIHAVPLYGAAAVVVFAFVLVVGAMATDTGKVVRTIGEPTAEVTIAFRDEADGIVSVFDADTKKTLARYGSGEGAFVRMSVRSMTLNRISKRVRPDLPYRLVRTASGKLSFIDPETGHFIKLNAFGSVAISSFAKFFPDHPEQGA